MLRIGIAVLALCSPVAGLVSEQPQAVERSRHNLRMRYSSSISELIRTGGYARVEGVEWQCRDDPRNEDRDLVVEFVRFDRRLGAEEAERMLARLGLRAASLKEVLALFAQDPDLKTHFPVVVALGTLCRTSPQPQETVAVFSRTPGGVSLHTWDRFTRWGAAENVWFPGVLQPPRVNPSPKKD